MDTLLLDSSFQPLEEITWERAVTMIVRGVAQVIATHDRVLRWARGSMRAPSVVRLVRATRRRRGVKYSASNLWIRDRGRCQYCGTEVSLQAATRDHVVPRARGGRTKWDNVVTACFPCNQRKGDRTPEEAGMLLRRAPERPKQLRTMIQPRYDDWALFLGKSR